MRENGRSIHLVTAVLVLAAAAGGGRQLFAQTEVESCTFKTRWKDAHGKCVSCCNSIEFSCPCTI
jgi:hypothetical protein